MMIEKEMRREREIFHSSMFIFVAVSNVHGPITPSILLSLLLPVLMCMVRIAPSIKTDKRAAKPNKPNQAKVNAAAKPTQTPRR
jgi:hypothetical protein